MAQIPLRAVGIAWYRESDYPRILQIMDDAHTLSNTYRQWEKLAEKAERTAKAQNHVVVRAVIDPDTFPAWCTLRGLHVDSRARMAFANEFAREFVKDTH